MTLIDIWLFQLTRRSWLLLLTLRSTYFKLRCHTGHAAGGELCNSDAVVRWHKLGEVENGCTSYILLAIFVPKIFTLGGIWQSSDKNNFAQFLARDSMLSALYAIAKISVRLSVTRVDQSKTVERIIEILSPPDRPNILVFRHQIWRLHPQRGRQIQGG